ncbi:hypothetical protein [Desulfopila aestuarii]|uniref:hypothetical protein n=1 Tax=Desulfopila aestuarii TaxID=231440 RepID=UPI0011613BDF|nr:hypothetical protein [Desulfopila aestuarii]
MDNSIIARRGRISHNEGFIIEECTHCWLLRNEKGAEAVRLDICAVKGVALYPDDDWLLDIDVVRIALQLNAGAGVIQ